MKKYRALIILVALILTLSGYSALVIYKYYNKVDFGLTEVKDSESSVVEEDIGLEGMSDLALPEKSNNLASSTLEEIEKISEEEIKATQEKFMLEYVIDCESSGIHEDNWGKQNEYGILQYKDYTFNYLARKYYFSGNWKDEDDQITLFLMVSDEDKEIHWSCYRDWLEEIN